MIEFLNYISTNGALSFITGLVFFCFAIKQAYDAYMWATNGFYNYHKDITKKEKLIESVDKLAERVENLEQRIITDNYNVRVPNIEQKIVHQGEQLDMISASLAKISQDLADIKKDNDKVAVAEIRSILQQIYNNGVSKGYATQSEMEAFIELSEIYLNKKGNSLFKSYIIPEYKKLRVADIGLHTEVNE